MKLGDMTPEQRRALTREAARKLEAELNHPAMVAALTAELEPVHEVKYRQKGPNTVEAVCTCKLRAESANGAGAARVMRRKHKNKRIRERAKARMAG